MKKFEGRAGHALLGAGTAVLLLLQGCSGTKPDEQAPVQKSTATLSTAAPVAAAKKEDDSPEPGTSLAFEWSANGFEQLPERYQWTGSGKRDADFQPHLSLSVPETDDGIWSSECTLEGKVKTALYLTPPEKMTGNGAVLKFETDRSVKTLQYDARYVATGQYDGFEVVLGPNDPMFADMKAGSWAYVQIGEGVGARKLRISLAKAREALDAFLPACAAR